MNLALFAAARRLSPLLVLTLFACSDVNGPHRVRQPAVLAFGQDTAQLTVPTTARVDEPITVVVMSLSGGCTGKGETEVVVTGSVAEVRPYRYDLVDLPPNEFCISILRRDSNVAVLTFSIPGSDTVRVIGVRQPGEVPYLVERQVTVNP